LGLTLTRIDEFSRAEEESGGLGIGQTSTSSVPYVTHFMAHAPIVDGSPAMIEVDRAAPRLASNISSTTGGTVTTVIGCNFAVTSWSLSARFGFTVAAVTKWQSDSAISYKIARGVGAGSSPPAFQRMRFCAYIFLCYAFLMTHLFAQGTRFVFHLANYVHVHSFHQHFRTPFLV
jgi:hypothetical protein